MNYGIGEKIKTLRHAKGITQETLAEKINLSRGTIAGYETNKRTPRLPELQKIAEFFGVGLDYFGIATKDEIFNILARAKDVFASEAICKEDKEELYKELMRLYLQLSDKA